MRQETGYLAPLRQQTASALEWPLSCIELVQRCTDLIDELQRERGLGQLVLSSVGESYAAALRDLWDSWRDKVEPGRAHAELEIVG